jgi:hypothetical protein
MLYRTKHGKLGDAIPLEPRQVRSTAFLSLVRGVEGLENAYQYLKNVVYCT